MLLEKLKTEIKQSMRDKNPRRTNVLRVAVGEAEMALARGHKVEDDQIANILRKLIQSNDEVIKSSKNEENVEKLNYENVVLRELLPQTWAVDEIENYIKSDDELVAILSESNVGKAIGGMVKVFTERKLPAAKADLSTAVRNLHGK